MDWKPITLAADAAVPQRSDVSSWQGMGKQGNYLLAVLTNRDMVGTDDAAEGAPPDPDTIIGYLISRGAFALPERAIRVSETGRRKWASKGEYRVPASELLVTAKAFCEYCDVHGDFPERKTWKTQAQLYRDIAEGKVTPPAPEVPGHGIGEQDTMPDLRNAPSMFSVFDESVEETLPRQEATSAVMSSEDYFPATPFTLVTDARADAEAGHEFVLHFDPELERYSVFFFAEERHANQVRDEFNEYSQNKWATVVRFDPRSIEERFGVRYYDRLGNVQDMGIVDYRSNMEIRNEFRRDD